MCRHAVEPSTFKAVGHRVLHWQPQALDCHLLIGDLTRELMIMMPRLIKQAPAMNGRLMGSPSKSQLSATPKSGTEKIKALAALAATRFST